MNLLARKSERGEVRAVKDMREPPRFILLVEDNPDTVDKTRGILEYYGFRVIVCGTVAQAREVVRKATPRMIILEGSLPDGSGFDFCRELRTEYGYKPPIFLHTALDGDENMKAGYMAGCADYLVKPVDMAILPLKVRAYLNWYESIG